MIGIINYGSGNIQAIATIYKYLNIDFQNHRFPMIKYDLIPSN